MARYIAFLLEIALEQFLYNPGLHIRPFRFAQLHQPVAISCISSLASESELYSRILAHCRQALDDYGRLFLAEFRREPGASVEADLGRGGVQIEGQPCDRECVRGGWMRGLVKGDAALQFVFPHVAPWADVVRCDGDVEICHFSEVEATMEIVFAEGLWWPFVTWVGLSVGPEEAWVIINLLPCFLGRTRGWRPAWSDITPMARRRVTVQSRCNIRKGRIG